MKLWLFHSQRGKKPHLFRKWTLVGQGHEICCARRPFFARFTGAVQNPAPDFRNECDLILSQFEDNWKFGSIGWQVLGSPNHHDGQQFCGTATEWLILRKITSSVAEKEVTRLYGRELRRHVMKGSCSVLTNSPPRWKTMDPSENVTTPVGSNEVRVKWTVVIFSTGCASDQSK